MYTIGSYPGGKSRMMQHNALYQNIPKNINSIIEPFSGFANVSINLAKSRTDEMKIWLNDGNRSVSELLKVLTNSSELENFINAVKEIQLVGKQDYLDFKDKTPVTRFDHALKAIVVSNCSVSGIGGGYSKIKASRPWAENKPKVWKKINSLFTNTRVTNLDYFDILNSIKNQKMSYDFLYLDPPYYNVAEKSKLYKNGYNFVNWTMLLESLVDVKIPWLISSKNNQEIAELASKILPNIHTLKYTIRSSLNSNNYDELLIANYPLID